MAVEGFSVYEAVKFENLIIEKAALEKLIKKAGVIMHIEEILIKPLLTEKAQWKLKMTNRYVFKVQRKASKYQVKDAVEKMFDVKVVNVKTATLLGKFKRAGKALEEVCFLEKSLCANPDGQKLELI